ncbi:MAG: nickel pincer cofactor biosynthesis protein LarB [Reichenbachiella sp.]
MNHKDFNIDFDRKSRVGFPEVVFGQSKTIEQLRNIIKNYLEKRQSVLATKVQEEKGNTLSKEFPGSFYDRDSGIFSISKEDERVLDDQVAIISGGTSDAYVVNEIYYTLLHLGVGAERIEDVGVSGIHRLLDRVDDLKKFKVIIAVAGFEAALPTVLGGLVPQPIIGVPTSVGYGVASGGHVALNSLLASCANGITVVNIDNGYGAAVAAFRMITMVMNIKID